MSYFTLFGDVCIVGILLFFCLTQEILDNYILCFRFGHAKGTELQKLLIVDSTDGGFMDDGGIYMLRLNLRDGTYLCVIHDNGITLDMSMTFIFSNCLRMKNLGRVSFSNRTGNNLGGRTCARTNSVESGSISTLVGRIVESTPLICTVSKVNTEFSPSSILVTGFRTLLPVPFPSP